MKLALPILIACCLHGVVQATTNEPPPLPAEDAQVFSPDELLIIDSYPAFMEADIIQQLANDRQFPAITLV